MTDLHVVASPSAAGSLRVATRELGLPGEVFCIADDLSLGPLADGMERGAFWRALHPFGTSEEPLPGATGSDPRDVFAPWRDLQVRVAADPPERVLVWLGGSGSDHVLLRMACAWLGKSGVALWRVPVPPMAGEHAVAAHSPEALVTFLPNAVFLGHPEIEALALEFADIASSPGLLRETDAAGRLRHLPLSAHDAAILARCPRVWTPAARVVGEVMGLSDPRNRLGDAFVASRLNQMIEAGLIESDGPRHLLRGHSVRRVTHDR